MVEGSWSKLRLGLAALAVFVVVFVGVRLLERARAGPSSAPPRVTLDQPSSSGATAAKVFVDVAGEVRRPGLYRIAQGARVAAAIRMAGGFTRRADSAAVNLAAPLQDGQQVVVPGGAGAAGSAPGAAGEKRAVSLSSASAEDLDSLDGIGPTLAQRIVEYRQAHGGFRSIDELRQVDGIGDKRFQQLKKALQP